MFGADSYASISFYDISVAATIKYKIDAQVTAVTGTTVSFTISTDYDCIFTRLKGNLVVISAQLTGN